MTRKPRAHPSASAPRFTDKQGQYLGFIHLYTLLHERPPAETDMQMRFRVSAPSIHQMVLTLERCGLIRRQPHVARRQHRGAGRSARVAAAAPEPPS
jgi:hypothetical protein